MIEVWTQEELQGRWSAFFRVGEGRKRNCGHLHWSEDAANTCGHARARAVAKAEK